MILIPSASANGVAVPVNQGSACAENEEPEQDLDALAAAQEAKTEAPASMATANRTMRDAREKQHHARQPTTTTVS